MFNSKLFTIFTALSFLALAASVAIQYLEMKEYNLDKALIARLSGGDKAETIAAPAKPSPAKVDDKDNKSE